MFNLIKMVTVTFTALITVVVLASTATAENGEQHAGYTKGYSDAAFAHAADQANQVSNYRSDPGVSAKIFSDTPIKFENRGNGVTDFRVLAQLPEYVTRGQFGQSKLFTLSNKKEFIIRVQYNGDGTFRTVGWWGA